jgi:hypothetical protein
VRGRHRRARETALEHLIRDYELLRNPDAEDRRRWVTIQVDSKVFDADKGSEAVLREMVNTVGSTGKPGAQVRCIVSVNMLSEGWDVKSVTHILGLRAFGSPLLTEQIIGRGLRRTNYDVLNQPLEERPEGSEETVDAFGIPFVGFPVQKRRRPPAGVWGQTPVWIEPDGKNEKYRVRMPNVRSWAVGVTQSLADLYPCRGPASDPDQSEGDTSGHPSTAGRGRRTRGRDDPHGSSQGVAGAAHCVPGGRGAVPDNESGICG